LIFNKILPLSKTSCFAVSIISSIWFLYWICYEGLVWNKFLSQATPVNYVALVLSIALFIIGTQLGRISLFKKLQLPLEQNSPKKCSEKNQMRQVQQIHEKEQIAQNQHVKDGKKQIPEDSEIPPGCNYYMGFLNNRPKSVEIPEECIGCVQIVNCLLVDNSQQMNSCA